MNNHKSKISNLIWDSADNSDPFWDLIKGIIPATTTNIVATQISDNLDRIIWSSIWRETRQDCKLKLDNDNL